MERTIAADLHACIEGLAKAAPATGEELTISTGNLNVTMVAVSAENVSSTIAEMRLNTTDDLAARVHVPTDLLSGTVGYDPTKPVAALLFTTSGTELYRPLSTATYARSSPPVSFSIVQDGVALPVHQTDIRTVIECFCHHGECIGMVTIIGVGVGDVPTTCQLYATIPSKIHPFAVGCAHIANIWISIEIFHGDGLLVFCGLAIDDDDFQFVILKQALFH